MPRCSAPPEPAETLASLLVCQGLAWPLARGLAPWVEAIGAARCGEMAGLLRDVRTCAVVLAGWIEDDEASAMGLRDAALASFELIDALDGDDNLLVEWRRNRAWAALRALATDLRMARPSPWAHERDLGW